MMEEPVRKKISVLGGMGMMGQEVVRLLDDRGYLVETADLYGADLVVDLSNQENIWRTLEWCDVGVGCLPGRLGSLARTQAAKMGRDFVDLSFSLDDPPEAPDSVLLVDCGLAPGLPNLVVGNALRGGLIGPVEILVGGISKDPEAPLGYVRTWSTEDLFEEYTRPARIVKGGELVTVDPLDSEHWRHFSLFGNRFVGFLSDGLRTLLGLKDKVFSMAEYTLRRPGHLLAVRNMIKRNSFVEEIEKMCPASNEDMVILVVKIGDETKLNFCHFGEEKCSAMTYLTAGTCAAAVGMVADGVWTKPGAFGLEAVGEHSKEGYDYIIGRVFSG
jgi:saccharopine dehydrogenase-like NADP-dependent oxidoreductase